MPELGNAEFGATTFCATSFPSDLCGANGLPLTPSSIKIHGRFQTLKKLNHRRICRYLDLVRGKHERVIVVHEHYSNNLALAIKTGKYSNAVDLLDLAYELIDGLSYLHSQGITHRNLHPDNILIDSKGHIKLSKYGLYHMTGGGTDVPFPVGCLRYMAPEVFIENQFRPKSGGSGNDDLDPQGERSCSGPKVDVWALGIILLQAYLGMDLWKELTMKQMINKLISFISSGKLPLALIKVELNIAEIDENVERLLRQCLSTSPRARPSCDALLAQDIFKPHKLNQIPHLNGYYMFSTEVRCKDIVIPEYQGWKPSDQEEDHLAERDISEVFYLWKLAGGDLEGTLRKCGLIRNRPPVTNLADFVVEDGEMFGIAQDRSVLLDETVVILSQEQLRQRLSLIEEAAFYPLLESEYSDSSLGKQSPDRDDKTHELPLVIKEKDVEYQFHRVILYDRLLKAYPYKRQDIHKQARIDIPPYVRAQVWAALLDIEGDVQGRYESIDKETPTSTDRQIEVDIPRCHQYDELLSSPAAHAKFKRVLKAWVMSHPEYVYWQGLDSLCAPFLYLHFNDEAVAYACLSAFIPKYLHQFFLKDNSPVIQEYLAVFSHLITFHDPELGGHMDGIGFIPDLYAIPWFLTMYAHVFPLHKVFHLWDTLLLGNSSFPLCIGVAILKQFRDRLLSFDFNECILLFSDMPEIDIGRCVDDSIKIFCSTPKSATYRQHARPESLTDIESVRPPKPNVSYYSQDYHERPQSQLSMEPIPLDELKSEKCPRISAEDLIELCELAGPSPTRSPAKKTQSGKPRILVIDVRSPEEYRRGTVPGCINIPFASAFTPEGELSACSAVQELNNRKNQVKVIVGSRGKHAVNLAHELVRLGYNKVCVLHKGIDAFRPTGYLYVPPDI